MRVLLFLLALVHYSKCSEVLRPRGVSLIKGPLYAPSDSFRCLDGSGSIPYSYINDDYCDCRDGSDEPGTSACPNGSFHCANIGHTALDLRSSRVNDGVCDCCDASDEWASGVDCTDVCLELGRAAREEALRKEEELKKGYSLKLGMIEQGKNIRREKENKIAQLKHELEIAEAEKLEKEKAKNAAEEPEAVALEKYKEAEDAKKDADTQSKLERNEEEAREVFDSLDSNADGALTPEELKQDTTYDTNRDGSVSDDEAAFYLQQSESVDFATFYSNSWRLMRPAYLYSKRKQPGNKPAPLFTPPTTPSPPSQEEIPPPEPTPAETTAEPETDGTPIEEDSELFNGEEGEPDYSDDEEEEGEVEEPPPSEIVYDDETQALVDAANSARSEYRESEKTVRNINKELSTEEESLNKDFGDEDQFRVLEGNCFEFTDREYTYKLCPFDKATQSPKNGGGETRLGTWGEWVEEEEGSVLYSAMKYTNGQGCWNGPNRSTQVNLVCGVENQLTGAHEPSKCEYVFTFSTPAACVQEENEPHLHTEL